MLPATDETRAAFSDALDSTIPFDAYGVEWVIVGWGGKGFYTTVGTYADLTAKAVWDGATGDTAVIRVDVAGALLPDPSIRYISVSPQQLEMLRTAVLNDISSGTPLASPGFTVSDDFFEAKGRFSLARTCNVWVGQKLREAGITLGAWTPTPYALTLSLWWHGHL